MSTAVMGPGEPGTRNLVLGAAWGIGAALLSAGWWVVTRFSVSHELDHLDHYDLAALRFAISGVLLLPVLLHRWAVIRRTSPLLLALMILTIGAPDSLVAGGGLRFAPAGSGGVLVPGALPLFAAALAALVFRERIDRLRCSGLGLIVAGIGAMASHGLVADPAATPGHLMFLGGALLWAGFTVALRKADLPPLVAVALVSVASMLLYLPLYVWLLEPRILSAPLEEAIVQALYQGVLAGIAGLYCFSRAVALLGAARGAAFAALVPVLATAIGVPLLGEYPSPEETAAVALVALGVCLASGARLALPVGERRTPRRATRPCSAAT
jgi:drug/metabolite transporter (DMT)-like permease